MSALWIGGLGLAALFVLILLQMPIAFAMIVAGIAGFGFQDGWGHALTLLATESTRVLSSSDMIVLPLFLIMGTFATAAGLSEDIFAVATAFLGHRRGGLAYATIGASAAFGSVCGSSTATAATFGKLALPQMLRRGYDTGFATGTIAAGGTLKSLIPPSLTMILYCVVTNTFILDLFVAALVPAALTILFNLLAIAYVVKRNPAIAPVSERMPWAERLQVLQRGIPALVLLAIVFGGLYSGIFTVNEAASVAAVVSVAYSLLRRRLTWNSFFNLLASLAGTTVMLYMILIGASVFTYFITLAHVPEELISAVAGLHLQRVALIGCLMVAYVILGTVFEELSAILITLPFVLPIVVGAGYDPVWWGVMNVIFCELALIHPPFGIIMFVLHGLAPDIRLGTMYRGVVPFLIADFLVLILLTLFPELAMWLPHLINPAS